MTKNEIKTQIDFSVGPLPDPENKEFGIFWQYVRKEELRFPHCRKCGKFHWYPQILCPHCQSDDIEWAKVGGQGKIFTWTTVRHSFLEAFKQRIPFILALVEFDDAPAVRFVTDIIECDPDDISIGMPVEPVFERVRDDLIMPVFRPVKK